MFACCAQAVVGRGELPKFPLRTDWVGDEVIAAPTAGGPEAVPQQLFGLWRVSLCVKTGMHRGHAWIRYENVHTGEVHTIGRFQSYVRPTRRRQTREVLYPKTKEAGLHWDYDWRFEHEVRQGKYLVDSVVVRDPMVFGHNDLHGHAIVRDNCITYARDAWAYYSGQHVDLAIIHTPENFLRRIEDMDGDDRERFGGEGLADRPQRWAEHSSLRRLPPVR